MPTFITIGYGEEAGYHQLSDDGKRAAHARDDELRASGALVGRAGDPVQVRNPDGAGVRIEPGPFLRSALPIAGFAVLEADDLDAAVERVSQTPCAVAHGVVEVWPLQT
ncbi:YciI family protein [Mycobacterium nebraskense]|uniref:Transcription initiation protein n=1 Tax=Mycobacterium nebraskense TaxID=244292 RepID=A0A1X1Z568_9MYCO|nr:YciI family protein [Mycobacterium nebraskense]KKB99935.1 transcription initiation protein [Mycobacterium nebraskense]MBI2694288.1 transcription initiation protein [Mycobacterium nebraskense]ORW18476.1 transcription initiation protein [Mycobacterium nebraskense]